MDVLQLFTDLPDELKTILSGLFGAGGLRIAQLLQTVKRAKALTTSTEIGNVNEVIAIYRQAVDDLTKKVDSLKGEIHELRDSIAELRSENTTLRGKANAAKPTKT